jgi:hypothetical protein
MSLTPLDTAGTPPRAPRRQPPAIRGKLKTALDSIVYDGKPWAEAAREAGLTTQAVRKALGKHHVQAYLKRERQVFRAAASGANIHHAIDVRDQKVNQTARIQAIRYLDGISEQDERTPGGQAVSPGVVVQVNVNRGPAEADETVIEISSGQGAAASQAADDGPQR